MIARCQRAATKVAPLLHRWLQLPANRFYATAGAAQPKLDPDYYNYGQYNDSDFCEPRGTAPMALADAETLVPVRGVQWAFIGSPRTKKHVYAEILSKHLEVPHISIATLVRQDLHPRSSLYKQIATAVNRGELVPEDIIFQLLSKRLEDGYNSGEMGFILDGIPRSRLQAEIVDQLAEIDLVVNFKPTDDFLVKDGQEHARKDEVKAHIEQRKLLEDYYHKQQKLLVVEVGNATGETWEGLLAALHLKHINADAFLRNWAQHLLCSDLNIPVTIYHSGVRNVFENLKYST